MTKKSPVHTHLQQKGQIESIVWFRNPANNFRESIPLGNGRLGAMIFGGVAEERIVLNESSLWSGAPFNDNIPEAYQILPEVQRLLLESKNDIADKLMMEYFICAGLGSAEGRGARVPFGCYQVLGNLHLSFHQNIINDTNLTAAPPLRREPYYRELNLSNAVMHMEYDWNGIRFHRDAFASAPGEAIILRLTADRPCSIFLRIRLDRPESFQITSVGTNELLMIGQLENGIDGKGVKYACRIHAANKGGEVRTFDNTLQSAGCDEVLLFITAATNAQTFGGRNLLDELAATETDLNSIIDRSWESLLEEHKSYYSPLYNRVVLNLGPTNSRLSALPTPERLFYMRSGSTDLGLETLYFNFGRYLLISSSRPGGLPANLQGIWAEEIQTPWNGDWHLDAQQMNYWPVEVCNLSDLHLPYLQLVASLQEPGSRTAQAYYGDRGWVAHIITNPWGFTAPLETTTWGYTALGSGWLCQHLWEHYLFTMDLNYLQWAYPIMKSAAQFYLDWLIEEPKYGWLVTAPSSSPENRFNLPNGTQTTVCIGSTYDIQIIRSLFFACRDASRMLGIDEVFSLKLDSALQRLPPTRIGVDGRVMEWIEDYPEVYPYHRHTSHLWGLFPGDEITPEDTPELARAARKTLDKRGYVTAGWAMSFRLCQRARLGDGDEAWEILHQQLCGSTFPNLFNRCYHTLETAEPTEDPDLFDFTHPFQIDGNLGTTAGIVEMLLQSHRGILRLLPALPNAWRHGHVRGLLARGGFVVDITWEDLQIIEAHICSCHGNPCRIKTCTPILVTCRGEPVNLVFSQNLVEFSTLAGEEYLVQPINLT
jgi:alpha-L-fucosidase 2